MAVTRELKLVGDGPSELAVKAIAKKELENRKEYLAQAEARFINAFIQLCEAQYKLQQDELAKYNNSTLKGINLMILPYAKKWATINMAFGLLVPIAGWVFLLLSLTDNFAGVSSLRYLHYRRILQKAYGPQYCLTARKIKNFYYLDCR